MVIFEASLDGPEFEAEMFMQIRPGRPKLKEFVGGRNLLLCRGVNIDFLTFQVRLPRLHWVSLDCRLQQTVCFHFGWIN